MDYSKLIDPDHSEPIYQQITGNLASWVQEGRLLPGDKLPTERELAERLGISRGTVSRAYEQLERMEVIESAPGRGTIISSRQDVVALSRKDRAVNILENAFREILRLRFSSREALTMAQLVFMEMESQRATIHVAAVDCNPESLSVLEEKLRYLSRVKLYPFDLYRLLDDNEAESKLAEYDLIITTTSHGIELERGIPGLKEKIVNIPMNPSRETIIALTKLSAKTRIGIFCESERFYQIISGQLESFNLRPPQRLRPEQGAAVLDDLDLVILPPSDPGGAETGMAPSLARFKEDGGTILVFDFQIDRATLSYLEERVKELLEQV